jgi:hypothetical protein
VHAQRLSDTDLDEELVQVEEEVSLIHYDALLDLCDARQEIKVLRGALGKWVERAPGYDPLVMHDTLTLLGRDEEAERLALALSAAEEERTP